MSHSMGILARLAQSVKEESPAEIISECAILVPLTSSNAFTVLFRDVLIPLLQIRRKDIGEESGVKLVHIATAHLATPHRHGRRIHLEKYLTCIVELNNTVILKRLFQSLLSEAKAIRPRSDAVDGDALAYVRVALASWIFLVLECVLEKGAKADNAVMSSLVAEAFALYENVCTWARASPTKLLHRRFVLFLSRIPDKYFSKLLEFVKASPQKYPCTIAVFAVAVGSKSDDDEKVRSAVTAAMAHALLSTPLSNTALAKYTSALSQLSQAQVEEHFGADIERNLKRCPEVVMGAVAAIVRATRWVPQGEQGEAVVQAIVQQMAAENVPLRKGAVDSLEALILAAEEKRRGELQGKLLGLLKTREFPQAHARLALLDVLRASAKGAMASSEVEGALCEFIEKDSAVEEVKIHALVVCEGQEGIVCGSVCY